MSVPHVVFLLVSLLAFGTAAPAPDECSQLNQTLTREELDKILGKWILIEAVSNNIYFDSVLEHLTSLVFMVNTTGDNNTLMFDQAHRLPIQDTDMKPPPPPRRTVDNQEQPVAKDGSHLGPIWDGQCLRPVVNVTFVSDKFLNVYLEVSTTYHRFLKTSQNCMLIHTRAKRVDYQGLYFFGRNTTVEASDLETFRKQAACLQFPLPAKFHYDPSKELCPVRV